MAVNIPLFLGRFSLSYIQESTCVEYFIKHRSSDKTISSALIFSCGLNKNDLHVSRFYPELYKQPHSKYMSAVCFYLLIHHCVKLFSMDGFSHISIETVPEISDGFYRKLGDFNFCVVKLGLGNVVELISDLRRLPVDISMIGKHRFETDEIAFLK
jgi:hypothetical protein